MAHDVLVPIRLPNRCLLVWGQSWSITGFRHLGSQWISQDGWRLSMQCVIRNQRPMMWTQLTVVGTGGRQKISWGHALGWPSSWSTPESHCWGDHRKVTLPERVAWRVPGIVLKDLKGSRVGHLRYRFPMMPTHFLDRDLRDKNSGKVQTPESSAANVESFAVKWMQWLGIQDLKILSKCYSYYILWGQLLAVQLQELPGTNYAMGPGRMVVIQQHCL